ncbi:hypothetical protein HaLaN_31863, partial [Haematococcus lacustris]
MSLQRWPRRSEQGRRSCIRLSDEKGSHAGPMGEWLTQLEH